MTRADRAEDEAQVVIVGGGPVGMGLAIELGQRGIACTVVERHAEPQPIPKGQNLTQRTMEHFHFWGAEAALRAARTIPAGYGIGGLTAYGTLLGEYTYDWLQRELVRPYYFRSNERLPQYATERVLRRRAAELSTVRTLYGWRVESIVEDGDDVQVRITRHRARRDTYGDSHRDTPPDALPDTRPDTRPETPPDALPDATGRRTLRACYVVGCDGSRSVVREQAAISQTLSDHDRLMVLLVFRSRRLHELLERYPGKSYYNVLQPQLRGYWKFFGRVDLGTTWFFHAPVPPGTTVDNFDFRSYLHEAVGAEFDVEFEHIGFWELRFAIADRYRAGRAFIAGDAAHSHPPYGGYGINTGFEDARNLGWKIAAVLQGWGGEALLDSYDLERRPVFESTARDFIARSIETDREFLQAFDPAVDRAAFERAWQARRDGAVGEVHSFEPHYEGSPLIAGNGGESPMLRSPAAPGGSAVGRHMFKARAGHHLAPAELSGGGNVYDRLGPGFTLLAFGSGDASASERASVGAFANAARDAGLPLTIVDERRDGESARYEAALVLVRPDQFVAWAGNGLVGEGDAARLLRIATGRPPE